VRSRVLLVDASALQLTRNPDGLGNVLRKMGGLLAEGEELARIQHANAERFSHLFMNAVRPALLDGASATHPRLQERLLRIYGHEQTWLEAPLGLPSAKTGSDVSIGADDATAADHVADPLEPDVPADTDAIADVTHGEGPLQQISLSEDIDRAVHDPHEAIVLILALFMESGAISPTMRRDFLQRYLPQQAEVALSLTMAIRKLPRNAHLPLLELSMPALRRLPVTAYMAMLDHVEQLVAEDRRVTLQEYILQLVLMRRLDTRTRHPVSVRFHALADLRNECIGLLSLVAHLVAPLEKLPPAAVFLRAAEVSPELSLKANDLLAPASLRRSDVTHILERFNQLELSQKPLLIKMLLAVTDQTQPLPQILADLLRAISIVLDLPLPATLASAYMMTSVPDSEQE